MHRYSKTMAEMLVVVAPKTSQGCLLGSILRTTKIIDLSCLQSTKCQEHVHHRLRGRTIRYQGAVGEEVGNINSRTCPS